MSTPDSLVFDEDTIAQAKRFNRRLAWAPRVRIRNRVTPVVIQALLRISQLAANRRIRRYGLRVEQGMAFSDSLRVPVRIIRPSGTAKGIILDIHGGGWALGNACMNDKQNAAMALRCHVAIVSVEYRLALHTPIQGLIDDCVAACRWFLEGGLPEYKELPVFMVGESAGGHLAAATLLQLKAWPHLLKRILGAVLYYGVYDVAGTPSVHKAGSETLVLHGPSMAKSLRLLTPGITDEERRRPPVSPLYGELSGFPSVLLYVGTTDPLRDDTILMAERWKQVAPVEAHVLSDAPHGFIHFPTKMADQVISHTCTWINNQIASARV